MAGIRRTWNKSYYEEKAKERLLKGEAEADSLPQRKSTVLSSVDKEREEFKRAAPDADGPMGSDRAFLNSRRERIDIDSKVGKIEMVDPTSIEKGAGGYWCEVCACLLKDSASYLDHINGKKHQRALGFSMRVERADVSKVKNRITELKRKIEDNKSAPCVLSIDTYDAKIAAQIADDELKKKKRKEAKVTALEREIEDNDNIDPDIAALLGFDGFGTSKPK